MATSPLAVVDLALLAGLEPFPLSLFSDGDRSTPDIALDGAIWPGGAYAYALDLAAGVEYRFGTSGAEDGFAERAMLVEQATGQVVWANGAAAEGFGYDPLTSAGLAVRPVQLDAPGTHLMYVWAAAAVPGEEPLPRSFHVEAHVDTVPVTDNEVYRFFDPARGIERLTASVALRDQLLVERPDLRYDGAAFVGDDTAREGWVGVHEVLDYVTGQRYYTANTAERDALLATMPAAADQGVAFYVPGQESENTAPVYRMTNLDSGNWFLTGNVNERLYLLLQGNWADQGVAFNAWVPPPPPPPEPTVPETPAVDAPADGGTATLVGVVEDQAPLIG